MCVVRHPFCELSEAMFAAVPTIPGFVGLFGLLEAATPGKRSKGASAWRNAADAGRALPPANLAAFPALPKKSRAVSAGCVLDALEGALAASDYAAVLSKEDAKASLLGLMLRAGVAREEAEQQWAEAEARVLEKSQEKVAMLTELATLLGRDAAGLKLRCTRVGGWIFSRYDAIALTLEPGQQDQARKIWDRMLETHPEVESLSGQGQETPVADIRGIVEMLLLAPGRRAAAFRRSVASVFVRCVGGARAALPSGGVSEPPGDGLRRGGGGSPLGAASRRFRRGAVVEASLPPVPGGGGAGRGRGGAGALGLGLHGARGRREGGARRLRQSRDREGGGGQGGARRLRAGFAREGRGGEASSAAHAPAAFERFAACPRRRPDDDVRLGQGRGAPDSPTASATRLALERKSRRTSIASFRARR